MSPIQYRAARLEDVPEMAEVFLTSHRGYVLTQQCTGNSTSGPYGAGGLQACAFYRHFSGRRTPTAGLFAV